jgi:hypothetical protein
MCTSVTHATDAWLVADVAELCHVDRELCQLKVAHFFIALVDCCFIIFFNVRLSVNILIKRVGVKFISNRYRFRASEFVFTNSLYRLTLWVPPCHFSWVDYSIVIGSAMISSVVIPISCTVISPPGNGAIFATTSAPFNPYCLAHNLYNYHSSSDPKCSIT